MESQPPLPSFSTILIVPRNKSTPLLSLLLELRNCSELIFTTSFQEFGAAKWTDSVFW